jgi:hypothetical protein
MITDDPGAPPAGTWEENLALTLTRTGQTSAWNTPFLDNNYSPADDLQLTFQTAPGIVDAPGSGPLGGAAPVTFAAKYRFLRQDANPVRLSAAFTPAFTLDTGTPALRRGLRETGWTLFLPIETNFPVSEHLDCFAEAGYLAAQFAADRWSYGLCADWHPARPDALHLLAEIHAFSDTAFRLNDVVLNLGLVCPLRKDTNLLLSAGRALRDSDESTRLVFYVGIQFLIH